MLLVLFERRKQRDNTTQISPLSPNLVIAVNIDVNCTERIVSCINNNSFASKSIRYSILFRTKPQPKIPTFPFEVQTQRVKEMCLQLSFLLKFLLLFNFQCAWNLGVSTNFLYKKSLIFHSILIFLSVKNTFE